MHPVNDRADDNSYTRDLANALRAEGVQVVRFEWGAALFADRPDIIHIHWPESVTSANGWWRSRIKIAAFHLLMTLARLRKIGLVATVHNVEPHESGDRFSSYTIARWYRTADARVYLTDAVRRAAPLGTGVHIPHQWYDVERADVEIERDLLTFGYMRRYKNLEGALDAAVALPQLSYAIIGHCAPDYALELRARLGEARNISLQPGGLAQGDLETAIRASRFVLLPYANFYSSGAALLALSLRRPVVLVSSPSALELQAEVGRQWVGLLDPVWGPSDLEVALQNLERTNELRALGQFEVASRQPRKVGQAHSALYASVVSGLRR